MNTNFEFDGVEGFEARDRLCQKSVVFGKSTLSCRVWQLKGIQHVHVVAAIYFKKSEPLDYIDNY